MNPEISIIIPVYNVEKYIAQMLDSVKNQTFRNFEVVIVNDGSPDNSQDIIDGFCEEDDRFVSFIKENGGVASARNYGLSKARGRFVVFYDPDDYIPKDALEKMYKTAAANDAEIVIGVMEEKSLGESLIYMHSQKLAKQKKISPLDQHFFGAWSLCHKMFSLDFIKKYDLKVEKLKNAEDGVFTFCALKNAQRIFGCDVVAYNYIKRPFWEMPSATQTISSEYLEGLLASHDRILQEALELAKKRFDNPNEYLEKLFERFIEGEMINGYYRGIWRASENLIPRITERTEMYREHISEETWNGILKRHRDLELESGYMTAEEMESKPLLTLVVSDDMDEKKINLFLGSLYNQQFPRFEVVVSDILRDKVDSVYKDMLNFHFKSGCGVSFKQEQARNARGKYVMIIDDFIMFTKNSLREMEKKLSADEKLDYVTMLVKNYDGKNFNKLKTLSAAYGRRKLMKNRYDSMDEFDTLVSNKMFRKSSLSSYNFNSNHHEDALMFPAAFNYAKLRKGIMISDITDEELAANAPDKPNRLIVNMNYLKNDTEDRVIQMLKRHITREDINKAKRIFGK